MRNSEIPKDILPTLVVGLGGTGFQIVKRLKKLFAKKYSDKSLPVRYLIIDTDLKSFLDDTLQNNEKCQLRFNEGVKTTLDWAYGNKNFSWLPNNPPITPDFFTSTDQGAGLIRPIGRLYFCKNSKLAYDTLNTARNDLVDLYKILTEVGAVHLENIDRHKVYIVGSLAGGTGCGTFLDVSVMLSKIFNRDNTNLIGMFTLESCYDDKLSSDLDAQNRSKANCYAALKELEFYMSSIKNEEDERYRFRYNNIGEIKLEKKLLDICYLVENKNEVGGVLTNIEDIYDLCSLQLFHEIGTKLGSQLRADYANFICKDKDPILNRDRHFSTFSSASMEIPGENIKRYSVYRLASDILNRLDKIRVNDIQKISSELISKIKEKLYIDSEYIQDYKLKKINNIEDGILLKVKNQLSSIEKKNCDKKMQWENNLQLNTDKVVSLVNEYISENSVEYGLSGLVEVLKNANNMLKIELNNITVPSNVGTATELSKDIDRTLEQVNKIKKSKALDKKKILEECKGKVNTFIYEQENIINYHILRELNNMVDKVINDEIDNIGLLKKHIHEYNNQIDMELKRIDNQANKTYGGNIISREMVSKEFYEKYYYDNYGEYLKETIAQMVNVDNIKEVFKNRKEKPNSDNLLSIIKDDVDILITLCNEKVNSDDRINNLSIIELLRKNAENEDKTANAYIKEELDITSKLAKPFWSAVKNPEVSWTECYYIGAVKDDNITNGFTIKPHEEIDSWVRSQTGERSRQARYVETTNPNTIDVIHITMGACAGYLPDIKHYKQFYLKLLSEKTYPLHLNENYIGLDDLDMDTDILFKQYTLAQAYGAIIRIHGKYVDNISDDGNKFIYKSQYCLPINESIIMCDEMPKNISEIDEEIILGNSQKDVLNTLMDKKRIYIKINKFIKEVESKYSEGEIREHKKLYIQSYKEIMKENLENKELDRVISDSGDFITYEKLRYQNSFK